LRAVFILLLFACPSSFGATLGTFNIHVTEDYARSSYRVFYTGPGIVTSPTGDYINGSIVPERTFNSWNQLALNLFGSWKLAGGAEEYKWSIAPFDYDAITAQAPPITPGDLSTVSSPFIITTAPVLSGSSTTYTGVVRPRFEHLSNGQRRITYDAAFPGASIEFKPVGAAQRLDQYVSAIDGPDVNPSLDLRAFLFFYRESRARYTATAPVPEPNAAAMLVVGGIVSLAAIRLRGSPGRHPPRGLPPAL
jgi:hypothetical protein